MNPSRLAVVATVASLIAMAVSLYTLSQQARMQADIERMVQMLSALHRPTSPTTEAPRPDFDRSEL